MDESKRQERWRLTRQAFKEAGRVLFAKQGVAETTMDEIAAHAGKHVQTLYRHFPTKSTLASALYMEEFKQALDARQTDTLVFWREWVRQSARKRKEYDDRHPTNKPVVFGPHHGDPPTDVIEEYIYELTAALAEDFKLDPEKSRLPVLIANMLWGANLDAVRRYRLGGLKGDPVKLGVQAAEEVRTIALKLLSEETAAEVPPALRSMT